MKPILFCKWLAIPTCCIVMNSRAAGDSLGFEHGFSGWLAVGNVEVKSAAPYKASEGTRLAVFNALNSTPNGYVETAMDTIPGHRYRLEFDVGNLAYNSMRQRMQVKVEDNVSIPPPQSARAPYVMDTTEIAGPGGGATAWVTKSYDFIAERGNVRLTFTDVSQATESLDLVLDHIRLTELPDPPPVSLVNGGFESGMAGWTATGNISLKWLSPYRATEGARLVAFNSGNSTPNGVLTQSVAVVRGHRYKLQFDVGNLAYNFQHQRMQVQMSGSMPAVADIIDIPGAGGGATAWVAAVYEFVALDAVTTLKFTDMSRPVTNAVDLVLDNVSLTEVFSENLIVNPGFEADLAGWDGGVASGGWGGVDTNVSVQSSPPYAPTEGSKLVAFNFGNTFPSAWFRQSVATIPGQRYRLEFDVGNLAFNTLHQRMHIEVSGSHPYVEDTFDIAGPGGGATAWVAASYEFVAAGDMVVVLFDDISQVTDSVDLVLDNVRLVAIP